VKVVAIVDDARYFRRKADWRSFELSTGKSDSPGIQFFPYWQFRIASRGLLHTRSGRHLGLPLNLWLRLSLTLRRCLRQALWRRRGWHLKARGWGQSRRESRLRLRLDNVRRRGALGSSRTSEYACDNTGHNQGPK